MKTIRAKLLISFSFLFVALITVGGLGWYSAKVANDGLNTVFADRVKPLDDLKRIADLNAASVKTLEQQSQTMDTRVSIFRVGENATAAPAVRKDAPPVARLARPAARHAPARKANGRGTIAGMQTALAEAFHEDNDMKEF